MDGDERTYTLFQPFPMRVIESECWTTKESTKKGPAPLFASILGSAAWNAKEIKGRSPLNYDAKRTE